MVMPQAKHRKEQRRDSEKQVKRKQTYVADDGPRSGFSLSGWKANRPRKAAAQLVLCLGQSFTYMVTRKSAT